MIDLTLIKHSCFPLNTMTKRVNSKKTKAPIARKSGNRADEDKGKSGDSGAQNERHKEDFERLLDDAVSGGRKKEVR